MHARLLDLMYVFWFLSWSGGAPIAVFVPIKMSWDPALHLLDAWADTRGLAALMLEKRGDGNPGKSRL